MTSRGWQARTDFQRKGFAILSGKYTPVSDNKDYEIFQEFSKLWEGLSAAYFCLEGFRNMSLRN